MRLNRCVTFAGLLCFTVGSVRFLACQDHTISDKEISVLKYEDLTYPTEARASWTEGTVVVRVKLDGNGNVTNATAISGAAALIPDCLANARKWRFRPNEHESSIIVYDFRMPGGECKAPSFFMLMKPNFARITGCEVPRSSEEQNPTSEK